MSPPHARARALTWLLRHGPEQAGLHMDAAGFVAVAEVLGWLRVPEAELDRIVAEDGKRRFERRGGLIRAAQGHSSDNGRVTREALEASWAPWTGPGPLWHGTTVAAAREIARTGIQPMARTHVHLALTLDSRVGKRAGVAVLLGVSPARLAAAGLGLWLSPNGVALAREVPAEAIVAVQAASRAAQAVDWAALFPGLSAA